MGRRLDDSYVEFLAGSRRPPYKISPWGEVECSYVEMYQISTKREQTVPRGTDYFPLVSVRFCHGIGAKISINSYAHILRTDDTYHWLLA